ncbi:ribonuclease H-like domain-containing protein [Spirulina subsalsa FACHB-351]|uniref:Ribonuclease H-like domain-containing protein n=1 Tax=Spirulina subsalsa FACHB-351 TaxID=234711 RepID=A0ABT3L267_9CYAN|nr:ribonuclease H-like domain-containing protein [Spirulina subsalsa]MCW6035591.1 ribonuclease H-like domain-containing protein [Spirulina subsalsa FACHB-351]
MTVTNFQVCDRDLDLDTLHRYQNAETLAIDTETMGLVLGRDRLCLVQICDPQGFVTAIRIEQGQIEAPHLKTLMEDPKITKIFHYARFDIAQLKYTFGILTQPIFCTKIASKLARTYTSSHGLKALVQELEKIELDKSSQSSDWGNPDNLSPEQLSYAANDVRYLISLRQKLLQMLEREGRLELVYRCFDCLPVLTDLDILQFQDIFEHK